MSGHLYNGTLRDDAARELFIESLRRTNLVDSRGKRLRVIVIRESDLGTMSQRNLARGWAGLIAKASGETAARTWHMLKLTLLGCVEIEDENGEPYLEAVSTKSLETKEDWAGFLYGIESIAWDYFSMTLPRPNDPVAWDLFRGTKNVRQHKATGALPAPKEK